jgi:hypothetical protein
MLDKYGGKQGEAALDWSSQTFAVIACSADEVSGRSMREMLLWTDTDDMGELLPILLSISIALSSIN